MSWITRKLDNLGAAALGGGLAAVSSQAPAFADAYLQRLGGRVDEARDTLARIEEGTMLPGATAETLHDLAREQAQHLHGLSTQYESLRAAHPAMRPLRVLLDLDPAVAGRVLADFTPALPLDIGGAVWVAVGLLLGLILWELVKAPATLLWTLAGDADAPPQRPSPRRRREPHL
jgi:hypothetical protein